jgi:hypothetical protein
MKRQGHFRKFWPTQRATTSIQQLAPAPTTSSKDDTEGVYWPVLEGQVPAALLMPRTPRHVQGIGSLAGHAKPDACAYHEAGRQVVRDERCRRKRWNGFTAAASL